MNRRAGTIVYKFRDAVNLILGEGTYQYYYTWDQAFSAALIYSVDRDYPVACQVLTGQLDVYNGADYSHYVLATGYRFGTVGGVSENDVEYNDPNYLTAYYGTHIDSWDVMADAIEDNNGLYISKAR